MAYTKAQLIRQSKAMWAKHAIAKRQADALADRAKKIDEQIAAM